MSLPSRIGLLIQFPESVLTSTSLTPDQIHSTGVAVATQLVISEEIPLPILKRNTDIPFCEIN